MVPIKIHFGAVDTVPISPTTRALLRQVASAVAKQHGFFNDFDTMGASPSKSAEKCPGFFNDFDTMGASPSKSAEKCPGFCSPRGYKFTAWEVSITFTSPQVIKEHNQTFRNKDAVTDVLSFPGSGGTKGPRGYKTTNLGDILICTQRAEQQADEYGHSLDRELAFLTAHGLLHLIGYDHTTPQEEEIMIAVQKAILDKVGVPR